MRISDWSSDVCSSDLLSLECVVTCFDQAVVADDAIDRAIELRGNATAAAKQFLHRRAVGVERIGKLVVVDGDRKSVVSGKSVSVRVVLGGRRIIKKNK